MAAGIYNFSIEQGTTFVRNFAYSDANGDAIDLTGYSARMHGRASYSSTSTVFTVSTPTLSPGTGLTIPTPANGTVVLTMSASTTSALPCGGVYDLEIISSGGDVTRLLQGTFTLVPESTR